jgi:hypothetical protein
MQHCNTSEKDALWKKPGFEVRIIQDISPSKRMED